MTNPPFFYFNLIYFVIGLILVFGNIFNNHISKWILLIGLIFIIFSLSGITGRLYPKYIKALKERENKR